MILQPANPVGNTAGIRSSLPLQPMLSFGPTGGDWVTCPLTAVEYHRLL